MKKHISLALSFASAAMLSASVISWELPNLESAGGSDLTGSISGDNIAFILVSDATYADGIITPNGTVSGENSNVGQDEEDGTWYGDWKDDNSSAGTYYMAFFENGKYYAITANGTDPVQISATASVDGAPVTTAEVPSTMFSDGAKTVVAVPEPATAILAFAGVAVLLRRRRVA